MQPFRFRLTTLLRLREGERDERRVRLAEAQRAEDIVLGQIQELQSELDRLAPTLRGYHCRATSISMPSWKVSASNCYSRRSGSKPKNNIGSLRPKHSAAAKR